MFYLLVNNIFFFIQKVKSKKGKKESKSLTVHGKTILGRTSGNPGFGVTGFQVTDNPENRINPDKPKHIFDNVLMLPAVCRPSQMLYGCCHCWLVVVMVPLLLVCVSPLWAALLWVGCYQVVLLCIERTGVEVAKMSSSSSASVRSSQIGNTSIAWMATDRQLI